MVVSTGNKSEIATGYATLYGDMAGGFSVLKDVPKTIVYQLANHINKNQEIIPKNIITKLLLFLPARPTHWLVSFFSSKFNRTIAIS